MEVGPLVSVLMTAYNREKYIAEAIASVLASTYTNFELIIVDDRSSDATVAIARKFEKADSRVHVYVNEHNLGDYLNRNKAASYAKGKYILYVDSDDQLYYHGLDVMVRFTEKFPDAGFGLGSFPDDHSPLPLLLTPRQIYLESFSTISHFDRAPGSGLIKRDAFNSMGGFSGKRMIGDYEFWFKLSRYYSMVKYPAHLHWNRIHSDQESQSSYARKSYATLRRTILEENLNHPDCPLSKIEIKQIQEQMRKTYVRMKLLGFLARVSRFLKLK